MSWRIIDGYSCDTCEDDLEANSDTPSSDWLCEGDKVRCAGTKKTIGHIHCDPDGDLFINFRRKCAYNARKQK